MRALDNLTHEASHHNLFRNRFLNQWFGLLFCTIPIGTSLYTYCQSHRQHHKHFGDSNKDPDLIRYGDLGIDLFPISRSKLILHLFKIFCLAHVPKYLWGTFRFFVHSPDEPGYEKAARWLFWTIVFIVLTIFNWWSYLLFWHGRSDIIWTPTGFYFS